MLCDRQPLCQPVLGHVIADGESLPAMLLSSGQLQENSTRSLCNVVILFFGLKLGLENFFAELPSTARKVKVDYINYEDCRT